MKNKNNKKIDTQKFKVNSITKDNKSNRYYQRND